MWHGFCYNITDNKIYVTGGRSEDLSSVSAFVPTVMNLWYSIR